MAEPAKPSFAELSRTKRKCRKCGEIAVVVSRKEHRYAECGLRTVLVKGMEIRTCSACKARQVVVQRVLELHQAIAMTLVRKRTRLAGDEIRFMRKHIDWSGKDLARHMGVAHETVSRWEHEREFMSAMADRLFKLIVVLKCGQTADFAIERLLEIAVTTEAEWATFQDVEGRWTEVRRAGQGVVE